MSKKKSRRQSEQTAQPRNRRRLVAIIALTLILATSGAIIAQRSSLWATLTTSRSSDEPQSQPQLAKEYIYAGGRLVATEEASGGGGSAPSVPANLVATASSSTQVFLQWDVSSGSVDHYEVQRIENIVTGSFITLSPNLTTNSFTDIGLTPDRTYIYRVRAVAAGGNGSGFSNLDLATTIIFADDPLTAVVTQIKAQHVTQLRLAVNAVRVAANLQAASWEDPSLTGLSVRAIHIQQLRDNLGPARQAIGVPAQNYTNQPLTQGIVVFKAHIEELRQGVK